MIFADLPQGESVFLDADTLVYHFQPHAVFGAACTDLIERIEHQELAGYSSTHILSEMAHRLMTLEACARFGWPYAGIAQRLRSHSAQVKTLTRFRQAVQEVAGCGIRVLTIRPDLPDAAAALSQQTGLLSNGALIVAVMQAHGLTNLASNDADFDGMPGLTRYGPV